MALWGLTGGIASGKSTVHRMLSERGAQMVDADSIYHRLISPADGLPSPLAKRVEDRFPGVLNDDGSLDRRTLGTVVFGDPAQRRILEEITHPAVAEAVGERLKELRAGGSEHIIYNVPLLYERGLDKGMDGVVVVWVPRHIQLARLIQRDQLNAREAEQRLAAQLPLDKKRDLARWVIDNSGRLEDTNAQVEAIWRSIQESGRSAAHG